MLETASYSSLPKPPKTKAEPEGGGKKEKEKEEEEEEEEGPRVDETQVERLYRLNEAYYRSLPLFEGPVPNLKGLELRPYQRQVTHPPTHPQSINE